MAMSATRLHAARWPRISLFVFIWFESPPSVKTGGERAGKAEYLHRTRG